MYVYAVLGATPAGALGTGLAGEALRVVRCGDLLAVTGDVTAAPSIDAASLRAHDATVRRLADVADAVLPLRFCTLVDDEGELAGLIEPQRARLSQALTLVAGREQMTLRLHGPRLQDDEPADEPATAAGPGARYLTERWRAQHRAHSAREMTVLRRALGGLVVGERVERHDVPPLLASLYHLIERGTSPVYLGAVEQVQAALAPVSARASGPWPPYAFAPGAVP